MPEIEKISTLIPDVAKRLKAAASSNPHYEAEVAARDTAVRDMAKAKREVELSPAIALRRELEKRLGELAGATADERRKAACTIIANAVARKYRTSANAVDVGKVVAAVATYGSSLVLDVAMEILTEPSDKSIRNIFSIFLGRLRVRQEAAS
ncbi:MAG: hypothetical protein SGI88_02100 [Candidatus Hydrogenedentes bacterium]|nr:hypothetical protein [Candidatus Hydrogenedentota bacterium]